MATRPIILAHGVLGFGTPLALPLFKLNYFNGVADHYRSQGRTVLTPQVNPIGSIAERGEQLAAAIRAVKEPVDIIAHSMGGLDARHAITHVFGDAKSVVTLITIGTPHSGSPVADAIEKGSGSLVAPHLERNAPALHDLTTTAAVGFNRKTPDIQGVTYINIAGDASKSNHELFLFKLTAILGHLNHGDIDDGVVTKSSALHPGHRHLDPDWPVDHAGEVGWSFEALSPKGHAEHLARYDQLLTLLK